MIVCNDAGHGGRDPGAVGATTKEKDNNLKLALMVGAHLVRCGVGVNYTRTTDKDFCPGEWAENADLTARVAVAGLPDVYVSYHNNSFDHSAVGTETYCYKLGGSDERLARAIQNRLGELPFQNRGVKTANFYVLRAYNGKNTSACLVEYGFIDSEEGKILEYMAQAAVKIAAGICDFLGVSWVGEVTPTVVTVDKDIYLSVRVLQSKAGQAIVDINKLGFAAKRMDLA